MRAKRRGRLKVQVERLILNTCLVPIDCAFCVELHEGGVLQGRTFERQRKGQAEGVPSAVLVKRAARKFHDTEHTVIGSNGLGVVGVVKQLDGGRIGQLHVVDDDLCGGVTRANFLESESQVEGLRLTSHLEVVGQRLGSGGCIADCFLRGAYGKRRAVSHVLHLAVPRERQLILAHGQHFLLDDVERRCRDAPVLAYVELIRIVVLLGLHNGPGVGIGIADLPASDGVNFVAVLGVQFSPLSRTEVKVLTQEARDVEVASLLSGVTVESAVQGRDSRLLAGVTVHVAVSTIVTSNAQRRGAFHHRLVALEEAQRLVGGIHLTDESIFDGAIGRGLRHVVESRADGIHLRYQRCPSLSTHRHATVVGAVLQIVVLLKALQGCNHGRAVYLHLLYLLAGCPNGFRESIDTGTEIVCRGSLGFIDSLL